MVKDYSNPQDKAAATDVQVNPVKSMLDQGAEDRFGSPTSSQGENEDAKSLSSDHLHSDGLQSESKHRGSDAKLDEFFDSYISDGSPHCITSPPQGAQSPCSDSVSRCGDGKGNSLKRSAHVEFLPGSNNVNQIPDPWFQQLQSDSSSLATLVTEKKISDSRRTFCLFVTFDLILTTLLWLIMCGTSATSEHSFFNIVGMQISQYSVQTSMFDVVCLAVARFVFLEISYALLRIRHWWPVALSTSATDILLILKIFPIFGAASSKSYLTDAIPMTIVVLLSNFILSWIEVWLIDFKVLPAEAKLANRTVRQFIQQSQNQHSLSHGQNEGHVNERTPLLNGLGPGRYTPPASSFYTGATSDKLSYHSVLESEFESPASEHRRGNVFPARITHEEQAHMERGKTALNQLYSLFKNESMWKLDKELDNGDRLFSSHVPGFGKTFRIDTVVHGVSAQQIFHEVILKAENMPSWNTAVDDVKILRRIGEQTAISLEVSKPAAKGIIQSRDFVTVRRVEKIDNKYISAGVSTDYSIPDTGRIRGINGPTGFIVEPCEGGFNSCKFTWILNTNLKGSLPQYLVNSNLAATMVNFVSSMKAHLGAE